MTWFVGPSRLMALQEHDKVLMCDICHTWQVLPTRADLAQANGPEWAHWQAQRHASTAAGSAAGRTAGSTGDRCAACALGTACEQEWGGEVGFGG